MAQTPEGKVKDRVKKLLKEYNAYYHMVVTNGMGSPTLDFIGCYHGKFFAIETKAHNKQMTDRQELTATVMREAGGAVFLINDETGVEPLKHWLEESK
jgi:hypothetical protein